MDIRRFFGGQPSKSGTAGTSKKVGAKASEAGEKSGEGKVRTKENNGKRRKSSKASESDEIPTKENKSRKNRKKIIAILDSDSSGEEPLPPKLRKTSSQSGNKTKVAVQKIVSSDEEEVLPARLNKVKKNEVPLKKTNEKERSSSAIGKSPVKVVKNFSEYFGDKPVERTFNKTHSSKRKDRSDETGPVETDKASSRNNGENSNNKSIINLDSPEKDIFHEQPHKKAKKISIEIQQSSLDVEEEQNKQTRKISSKPEKCESISKVSPHLKSSPKKLEKDVHSTKTVKSERKSSTSTKSSRTKSKGKDEVEHSRKDEVEHSQYFSKKFSPTKSLPSKSSPSKSSPSKSSPSMSSPSMSSPSMSSPLMSSPLKLSSSKSEEKSTRVEISETISTTPLKSTPNKPSSTPDVIPSSLERKASGYRSFMAREGPKAIGSKDIPKGSESCLAGLVFVVTGILESIEREDAQDFIKRHGGKVTQSLSKKTTYIVVGRDPGESKMDKAKKFSTKQLDEDGLFDLVRKSNEKLSKTSNTSSKTTKEKVPSPSLSTSCKSESQISVDFSPSQKLSQSSVFSSACSTPATQTPSTSPLAKGVDSDSLLWVDKYSPKTIKQIIGQQGDKSNVKKLLRWLHSWYANQKSAKSKAGFFAGKEDGSIFKAALLSGPPGVGKTTSAQLVCKESGFSFVEFNASDSRSKKTLEEKISEILDNKTMDGYLLNAGPKTSSENHVLIMDEVDGMAGNEDRGGMQELINLIKSTKTPIICMCNDRNSQKVRSLANHCFDLRFQRPRLEQIKGAMMKVAFKENITISPQAMEKVIVGANQDVRQVLYNLCMWTSKQKSLNYDEAKFDAAKAQKDIKLGPFDVTRKIFSSEESSKMNMHEYFSLFFNDYSLIPLFSQENYIHVVPYSAEGDPKKVLKSLSEAADSFCDSDLVDKCIRSKGSWNLLPLQSFYSCVRPGKIMKGRLGQRIDFPSWLGKNSTTNKNSRILQDLVSHAVLSISGSKLELNLEYIPHLRNVLTRPLINANSENCSSKVSEVIGIMDSYHLTREDWENVLEIGQFPGKEKLQTQIESKVKSAFTRTYNKEAHLAPYSSQTTAKKNPRGTSDDVGDNNEAGGAEGDSDDDNIEKNAMIKVKKTTGGKGKPKGASSKTKEAKGSRGKGVGKGKGKNK